MFGLSHEKFDVCPRPNIYTVRHWSSHYNRMIVKRHYYTDSLKISSGDLDHLDSCDLSFSNLMSSIAVKHESIK